MCPSYLGDHFWPHKMPSSIVGMGVMQLTFGNMTLKLNIFHLSNKHANPEEVCLIGTSAGENCARKLKG